MIIADTQMMNWMQHAALPRHNQSMLSAWSARCNARRGSYEITSVGVLPARNVVDVAQLTAVHESRSRGSGIARSNVTGKKGSQMPINSKYLFVASMDVDPDK